MTPAGRRLLIDLEGLKLKPYKDVAGLPTIGVGHLLTRDELSSGKIRVASHIFDYRKGLTRAQALELLDYDLLPVMTAVSHVVAVPLSAQQLDALVLFSYNIGVSAFSHSTLVKKLNAGDYLAVPGELRRWVFAAGRRVQGLVRRREVEIAVWLTKGGAALNAPGSPSPLLTDSPRTKKPLHPAP